jgi:hypothetical protein
MLDWRYLQENERVYIISKNFNKAIALPSVLKHLWFTDRKRDRLKQKWILRTASIMGCML